MAITMRKGLLKDFNPDRMLPGEWAVSVDPETQNRVVYMCFAPGREGVKRMGTLEDFKEWFDAEFTTAIAPYEEIFTAIQEECERIEADTRSIEIEVIQIRDGFVSSYMPQLEALKEQATESATEALNAKDWIQNDFNIDVRKKVTQGLVDTYEITYQNDKHFEFDVTNGAEGPQGPQGEPGNQGPKGEKGDKGDKGDKGVASETIDDTVTNENHTWSSSKIQNELNSIEVDVIKTSTSDLDNSVDGNIRSLHMWGRGEKTADRLITSEGIVESATRNLLEPKFESTTLNGITVTKNNDGTYLVNGTATANTFIVIQRFNFDADITYKICGCPSGGGANTYRMDVNGVSIDTGNGSTYSRTTPSSEDVRIRIGSGTVVNNLLFKPMVTTDLSFTYDDYVPYTTSSINASEILNSSFTGVNDIKDELIVNADGSGKFIKKVGRSKLKAIFLIDASTSTFWDTSFQNKSIIDISKTILCNRLERKTYNEVRTDHMMGFGILNDGNLAFSVGSGASTVEEMNAILATNPIEIIYVLTTPIETDLTPSQVSALLSLKTFTDTTFITSDCDADLGYYVNSEVGQSIADLNSTMWNMIRGLLND